MINIIDKQDCCGCFACANVCPKQCIGMEEDCEGFRYPKVDTDICIDCHLCEKVCPIINVEQEVKKPQSAFLLQHKDNEIRKESTSGGAFTAIASWIIDRGGVVFGAAFEENFIVRHRYVDKTEDLHLFRNSKYVQSEIGDTYKHVLTFLKEGRWVAFSGTPCQIEGLGHYLRKVYEKLVLIDVVCYGIPSPGIFADYLKFMQDKIGGTFKRILFREKRLCYNYTSFSLYNDVAANDYHSGVERDKYMRSFFSNLNIRPSCYDCKFKKRYRVSDFTIWDCYDVRKFSKNFDDNGTNRILAHTDKARIIINEIKNKIRIEEYKDIDYFISDETAMMQSVPMPKNRKKFFHDYASLTFDVFINKWFADTWNVRINSWLRVTAFKLGVYNKAKRIVKVVLHKK